MIVVCAACAKAGEPSFQREKPPFDDTRISHGMCQTHALEWRAAAERLHAERAGARA